MDGILELVTQTKRLNADIPNLNLKAPSKVVTCYIEAAL